MSATSKSKEIIFIHIPKTGGTSVNCELNDSDWQTRPDFNYRHILYDTKKSNSADIFDSNELKKYQDYNIFMFLRDPINRLFSEYYFLKDRKEFMALLPKRPRNFYDYCMMSNTNNAMIKFLLGHRIYSSIGVNEEDYLQVLNAVEALPIRIGIFEKFVDSLSYLSEEFGVSWSQVIEKKRVTISKPHEHDLTSSEVQIIKEKNKFDYLLYEKSLLKLNKSNFDQLDIEIEGNKYDYVLKYTERFILFESVLTNRDFLKINRKVFVRFNLTIHSQFNNGRKYVEFWNESVKNALVKTYGECGLTDALGSHKIEDPLEYSFYIAECINNYFDSVPAVRRIDAVNF